MVKGHEHWGPAPRPPGGRELLGFVEFVGFVEFIEFVEFVEFVEFPGFAPMPCGVPDRSRESSDLGFAGIEFVGLS
ncbi:MAG: hypothetical protein ACLFVD_04895 [Dehalococcoidia bacterium]